MHNPSPDPLFWLAFAGVVIYLVFKVVRRGGFKAAFFNARIASTVGDVEASGPKLVSQKIQVHTLDRDGQTFVGVAITSKTFLSYQMLPVVLSPEQAQQLSSLLKDASVRR